MLPSAWNMDSMGSSYPPTLFISMPRDLKTADRIKQVGRQKRSQCCGCMRRVACWLAGHAHEVCGSATQIERKWRLKAQPVQHRHFSAKPS